MEYLLYFCIFVLCIFLLILKRKNTKYKKRIYNELDERIRICNNTVDTVETQIRAKYEQLDDLNKDLDVYRDIKANLESDIGRLGEQVKSAQEAAKEAAKSQLDFQKQYIDEQLASYEKSRRETLELEITNRATELRQQSQKEQDDWVAAQLLQRAEMMEHFQLAQQEYNEILTQLEDYKARRQQINEEILRQRAIDEQQDFYRIILTPETIDDIQVIQSIREKLHKREYLDKMLYDNYIAKAVKEMTKRVLKGEDPSGIYKITNIKTQEVYIGKSTTVATRWTNHIKSACGLSGVADSRFQRALKKYGIENWTFELLEEVSKDKLGDREKYYIDFYGTKEYGYNDRLG